MNSLIELLDKVRDLLPSHSAEPLASSATKLMRTAAACPALLDDLARVAVGKATDPEWRGEALVDDGLALALKMFVWPPGASSGIHRHLDWTATAIIHGQLFVETFDEDTDPPVPAATYHGSRGDAGFLSPPCTHRVRNPGPGWTISLHLFSGPIVAGGEVPFRGRTEQTTPVESGSWSNAELLLIGAAELAAAMEGPCATELLERVARSNPPSAALHAVRLIARTDRQYAGELAISIAAGLSGANAVHVEGLGRTLLAPRAPETPMHG